MPETKKCPSCAEEIKIEAKKCRFCGEILESQEELNKVIFTSKAKKSTIIVYLIIGIITISFFVGIIFLYIALRYYKGKIELTKNGFHFYQGIFVKKHTFLSYKQIESATILVNTIRITGSGGKKIQIDGYENLDKVQEIINNNK